MSKPTEITNISFIMWFFKKKTPEEQAQSDLKKGDALFKKGQKLKAYHAYQSAVENDENLLEVYDKMIEILKEHDGEWTEEHFAHSIFWEMRKKEIENPKFKRIHFRNEPEHGEISALIKKMLATKNENEETQCVEKIVEYQGDALYPLIDFILAFKEMGNPKKEREE